MAGRCVPNKCLSATQYPQELVQPNIWFHRQLLLSLNPLHCQEGKDRFTHPNTHHTPRLNMEFEKKETSCYFPTSSPWKAGPEKQSFAAQTSFTIPCTQVAVPGASANSTEVWLGLQSFKHIFDQGFTKGVFARYSNK